MEVQFVKAKNVLFTAGKELELIERTFLPDHLSKRDTVPRKNLVAFMIIFTEGNSLAKICLFSFNFSRIKFSLAK